MYRMNEFYPAMAWYRCTSFVQIYGAYIGNIALLFKPYGGIFITGGIAAKIVNKMQSEEFIYAYLKEGKNAHTGRADSGLSCHQ